MIDGGFAEFRGPDVDGDEAEPRVPDGLPVFPVHLSENTRWSVNHYHQRNSFLKNDIMLFISLLCSLPHISQCKIRRGILRPPPPSGVPLWSPPSPWNNHRRIPGTSRPDEHPGPRRVHGLLRQPLALLPHRPLHRLPGGLGLLGSWSSEGSFSAADEAKNEGSVKRG